VGGRLKNAETPYFATSTSPSRQSPHRSLSPSTWPCGTSVCSTPARYAILDSLRSSSYTSPSLSLYTVFPSETHSSTSTHGSVTFTPRVTPSLPFHHTGMDYAGPFNVRSTTLRKSSVIKSYLCVFICFSTKAVHLEVAADLSAGSFIDVLRRFVICCGAPECLYSDCGTNFVGANSRLQSLFNSFISTHSDLLRHHAGTKGIMFNFLPLSASYQGGL
jgi:hypothetical protein